MNEVPRHLNTPACDTSEQRKHIITDVWKPSPELRKNRRKGALPGSVQDLARQLARIEQRTFGIFGYTRDMVENQLAGEENTTVLLWDSPKRSTVIGYVFAIPLEVAYAESFYKDRKVRPHTAYITSTVIVREHRGQRLVGPLMKALEEVLKQKGYSHIERDSSAGAYADNVRKNNVDKIEEEIPHDSQVGPQVFFRMRLAE